jgi:hypothetical protein
MIKIWLAIIISFVVSTILGLVVIALFQNQVLAIILSAITFSMFIQMAFLTLILIELMDLKLPLKKV